MSLFSDYGLSEDLLKAITELGYSEPTPIQKETLPYLLSNDQDMIALAQTGTGKTAAFSLPILEQLDADSRTIQVLILCPTRELCLQIARDIETYTKYMRGVKSQAVYGGASITDQIRGLKGKPQIIIGTPGRMNDMIKRGALDLGEVRWLVLDEADEMLSMGFKTELETILQRTPDTRQTMLFSATMSTQVEKIAKGYMKGAHKISAGGINEVKKNITHKFVVARQKNSALKRILDSYPDNYSIIFCRTRMETQNLADYLMQQGYSADCLHGDLSQAQRDTVMKKFRLKHIQTLVATDVAARGLDVTDLTHVIHFTLPDDPEVFVHRSGRTGRAGKDGLSIAVVRSAEMGKFRRIQKDTSIKVEEMPIPTNEDIMKAKEQVLSSKLLAEDFSTGEFELVTTPDLESITKEELFKRVMFLELNETWTYYKENRDQEKSSFDRDDRRGDRGDRRGGDRGDRRDRFERDDRRGDRGDRRERFDRGDRDDRGGRPRTKREGFTRFFFNIGRRDELNKMDVLELINENTSSRAEIGAIDVRDKFSFFEVQDSHKDELLQKVNNMSDYRGKRVSLEVAN